WALNPMNQPALSKIILQSFAEHYLRGKPATAAFKEAVLWHCGQVTSSIVLEHHTRFAREGLIELSEEEKFFWRNKLAPIDGPIEQELMRWLNGEYAVAIEDVIEQ